MIIILLMPLPLRWYDILMMIISWYRRHFIAIICLLTPLLLFSPLIAIFAYAITLMLSFFRAAFLYWCHYLLAAAFAAAADYDAIFADIIDADILMPCLMLMLNIIDYYYWLILFIFAVRFSVFFSFAAMMPLRWWWCHFRHAFLCHAVDDTIYDWLQMSTFSDASIMIADDW